jgi:two-component system, NarL family, sensor kinase
MIFLSQRPRFMSPRKKAQIAFASAVSLLALSGVAAYVSIVRLLESEELVIHTLRVQSALGDFTNAIAKVGRAATAYVATGNEEFLDDFQPYLDGVAPTMQHLRDLTKDNPAQQALCDRLQQVTQQRMLLFQRSIELKKNSPKDETAQVRIRQQTAPFSSDTTDITSQMRQAEDVLLNVRQRASADRLKLTILILGFTFVIALALFSINYRLLSTELRARERAEHASRALSAHVMRLRDEERRKFSRELHDSLGQYLAGLKMSLGMLAPNHTDDPRYFECMQMLEQCIAETRTISHLLHPPMLDVAGFATTAKWFVEGFSQRSGVEVRADIAEGPGRLPSNVELVLFRVLQESLTNIHRHSRSTKAEVVLQLVAEDAVLSVRDFGTGVPADVLARFHTDDASGVGLAGMRERVRELAGQFEIHSDSTGTTVRVSIPLKGAAVAADANAAD